MSQQSAELSLRERIGIALRIDHDIPDKLEWAGEHAVHFVDFHLDDRGPDPSAYPADEVSDIQRLTEKYDITFGLHSLSGVNVAETEPVVDEAVEEYLRDYIDLAAHLGAAYVVHHPGFHFTDDRSERMATSIDRLGRVGKYANSLGITMTSCNMNPEPDRSEIDYLGSTLAECQQYAQALPTEYLEWSFNAPHAHLTEAGIGGFIDGLDGSRLGLVRVNDNRGIEEEHLSIGEGTIDFRAMINGLEEAGFEGHFIISYGSNEDMLVEREKLLEQV